MSDVLIKSGNWDTDTHREVPCGDKGRDWGNASTSQGMPSTASDHQKLGETWNRLSLKRNRPPDTSARPVQPKAALSSPPVDHLVTLLQPADARHPPPGGGTIQVHDHVILRHQEFQTADDIPGHGAQRTGDPVRGCPELGSPRS